jgi:hypothetical protein
MELEIENLKKEKEIQKGENRVDRIAIEVLKKEMVKNAEIQNKQETRQDSEILKLEEQVEELNDLKH